MSTIRTSDAAGTDCGPASPMALDGQTWQETVLEIDDEPQQSAVDRQRPVRPAHIFTGVAVAIAVFGTMMAILALSAETQMQRHHDALASKPAQHAAADRAATSPLSA